MQDLIFLHGALGQRTQWSDHLQKFESRYTIHKLDFPAHGQMPPSHPTHLETLDSLTAAVKQYIEQHQIKTFSIIGYSLGGYVGLKCACERMPGLKQIVCLATKTSWDSDVAAMEISKISAENLKAIWPKLQAAHLLAPDKLIMHTHSILRSIGQNPIQAVDLNLIEIPVTFLLGENDRMVTREENEAFQSLVSGAAYKLLPGQGHLLEKMDTALLSDYLLQSLM